MVTDTHRVIVADDDDDLLARGPKGQTAPGRDLRLYLRRGGGRTMEA
jgi:hypothetical protein